MSVDPLDNLFTHMDLMNLPQVPSTEENDFDLITLGGAHDFTQPDVEPQCDSTICSTEGNETFLTHSDHFVGNLE